MKRKSLWILLVALVFAGCGLGGGAVHASAKINGQEFWSVAELLALDEQMTRQRETYCKNSADNNSCQHSYFWNKQRRGGGVNGAWGSLKMSRMVVSSINPELNTIRFLYHNDNLGQKFSSTALPWPVDATDLYIVWLDDDQIDPNQVELVRDEHGMKFPWYAMAIKNGTENPGLHVLYARNKWENPELPDLLSAVEIEVDAGENLLKKNNSHKIYGTMQDNLSGGIFETYDYGECLASPYYRKGMECRMVFNSEYQRKYLPFWPGEETATRGSLEEFLLMYPVDDGDDDVAGDDDDNDNDDDVIGDNSGHGEVASDERNEAGKGGDIEENEYSGVPVENDDGFGEVIIDVAANRGEISDSGQAFEVNVIPPSAVVGAPESNVVAVAEDLRVEPLAEDFVVPKTYGTVVEATSCREFEFPWWIVILLVVLDMAILWWFLPKDKRAHK